MTTPTPPPPSQTENEVQSLNLPPSAQPLPPLPPRSLPSSLPQQQQHRQEQIPLRRPDHKTRSDNNENTAGLMAPRESRQTQTQTPSAYASPPPRSSRHHPTSAQQPDKHHQHHAHHDVHDDAIDAHHDAHHVDHDPSPPQYFHASVPPSIRALDRASLEQELLKAQHNLSAFRSSFHASEARLQRAHYAGRRVAAEVDRLEDVARARHTECEALRGKNEGLLKEVGGLEQRVADSAEVKGELGRIKKELEKARREVERGRARHEADVVAVMHEVASIVREGRKAGVGVGVGVGVEGKVEMMERLEGLLVTLKRKTDDMRASGG